MGPFFKEERISLLSPQMSLFVQPRIWRPEVSKRLNWVSLVIRSLRGSSICSMVLKGRTRLQTSWVLPFHTSSTSRSSSNKRNRYFSGKGLPSWINLTASRFSLSDNFIVKGLNQLYLPYSQLMIKCFKNKIGSRFCGIYCKFGMVFLGFIANSMGITHFIS